MLLIFANLLRAIKRLEEQLLELNPNGEESINLAKEIKQYRDGRIKS